MNSRSVQATTSSTSSRVIWPALGNKDEGDRVGGFTRLEEPAGSRWAHDTNIHRGRHEARGTHEDDIGLEEMNVPRGGIKVKNEVVITTEAWDYKDELF